MDVSAKGWVGLLDEIGASAERINFRQRRIADYEENGANRALYP